MKIKSIEIINNDILGNLTFDFTLNGKIADTIIFAGENGCGKSTILNLIYDLSLCQIINKNNSQEKRIYKLELSQDDIAYFGRKLPEQINKPFKENLIKKEIVVSYDLNIQSDWNQIKVELDYVDGKKSSHQFPEFLSAKRCFKTIFSDVEINFNSSNITSVTSKNIDQENDTSSRSKGNLATEITQLLVDIQALDDADFTTAARTNPSDEFDRNLLDVRINRFKKAYTYMFPTKKYSRIETINNSKHVIFEDNGKQMSIEDLSSGEKQIVFRGGFLLKDQGNNTGSIIIIDEPELSLHPQWQLKILDFYKMLCTNREGKQTSQLFIATHSPFILHNDNRMNDICIVLSRDSSGNINSDNNGSFFGWTPQKTIEQAFHIDMNMGKTKPTVITEGKTDWKHLKKALSKLQAKGSFIDLDIELLEYEDDMGDSKLKVMCENYARVGNVYPIIFIFDRDNPKIFKEICGTSEYKIWGNNVYSLAIPIPTHRSGTPEISIEFYYSDDEIKKTDNEGRRLYISTEFNNNSGRHNGDSMLTCNDSKARFDRLAIIDANVFNTDNCNIALSKNIFADNIMRDIEPFNEFKFDEFIKIFSVIEKILKK
jgi:predicted ATPase